MMSDSLPKAGTSSVGDNFRSSILAAPPNSPLSANSPDSPRLASESVSTPLFSVALTAANGSATVNFTAPFNLGTFVVRAFAVSGSKALYGAAESELIVRRPISLTASLPRFARVGDSFKGGVVVTATGIESSASPFQVKVSLGTIDGSSVVSTSSFSSFKVTLSGQDTQQEVSFNFKVCYHDISSSNMTHLHQTCSNSPPHHIIELRPSLSGPPASPFLLLIQMGPLMLFLSISRWRGNNSL